VEKGEKVKGQPVTEALPEGLPQLQTPWQSSLSIAEGSSTGSHTDTPSFNEKSAPGKQNI